METHSRSSSVTRRESHFNQQRSSFRSHQSTSRPQSMQSRTNSYRRSIPTRGHSVMSGDAFTIHDEEPNTDPDLDTIETADETEARSYDPEGVRSPGRTSRNSGMTEQYPYDGSDEARVPARRSRRRSTRTSARRASTPQAIVEDMADIRPLEPPLAEEPVAWYSNEEHPSSTLPVTVTSATDGLEMVAEEGEQPSRAVMQLYAVAYLTLFSMLGTLARVGLQSLTFYPGAPAVTGVLWANFAGCLLMGFFARYREIGALAGHGKTGVDVYSRQDFLPDQSHIREHSPLYIGLTTGFCGSLTSFSSFMRDAFLALSNDLSTPSSSVINPRHAGYSALAVPAVLLLTICLSITAYHLGTHLAQTIHSSPLPSRLKPPHTILNITTLLLAIVSWTTLLILLIHLPTPSWRIHCSILFSLVLSPPGCLLRHALARRLNTLRPSAISFPLGTFAANLLGTAILAAAFALQRVRIAEADRLLVCQALHGLQEGFCGALTTVSAWVAELVALGRTRRAREMVTTRDDGRLEKGLKDAYVYGASSVVAGLVLVVAIMGSVRWSVGWQDIACSAGF